MPAGRTAAFAPICPVPRCRAQDSVLAEHPRVTALCRSRRPTDAYRPIAEKLSRTLDVLDAGIDGGGKMLFVARASSKLWRISRRSPGSSAARGSGCFRAPKAAGASRRLGVFTRGSGKSADPFCRNSWGGNARYCTSSRCRSCAARASDPESASPRSSPG